MYFLEKLCRICVQSGVPLVSVDTIDFDSVSLSEKLEICANLVISDDQISSEICEKCANKLRVSYHFLNMCKQSTKIIQSYLGKLTNIHQDKDSVNVECTDLSVELEKLPEIKVEIFEQEAAYDAEPELSQSSNILQQHIPRTNSLHKKKQRITKVQRCSLLQQLLNRPKKERDKFSFDSQKGGLKNIINFTKNYEFSFNLDKNSNIESTPLDKLTAFSTNFFKRDFTEFKDHILFVIENRHMFECDSLFGSEDEDTLTDDDYDSEEEEEDISKEERFEQVLVEPDIKVKKELMDCEGDDEPGNPLDYLETTIDEVKIKKEEPLSDSEDAKLQISQSSSYHVSSRLDDSSSVDHELNLTSSPSVKLLDRLVSTYPLGSRKIFSPSNARCRTRDMPYINPTLKNQFLYRSFKCERCNRYFKSQGYLKAHTSKVH